jgi:hypothetical protein
MSLPFRRRYARKEKPYGFCTLCRFFKIKKLAKSCEALCVRFSPDGGMRVNIRYLCTKGNECAQTSIAELELQAHNK